MDETNDRNLDREALLEGLRGVGLNRYESAVYLGLVTDQDAKVAEISRRTGVPQPKVYQALDALVNKGFCALGSDSVNRYRPVSPPVALAGFVSSLREQERSAQELGSVLEDLLQEGKGQELWAPPVEVVKGIRQIKRILVAKIGVARQEILCYCMGPHVGALEVARALQEATERGVSLKMLSDATYYHGDGELEEQLAIYRSLRAEKRRLESVPTKMVLCDRQIAMVSISRTDSRADDFLTLVLRNAGLVEHFLNSFAHGWERGTPLEL